MEKNTPAGVALHAIYEIPIPRSAGVGVGVPGVLSIDSDGEPLDVVEHDGHLFKNAGLDATLGAYLFVAGAP